VKKTTKYSDARSFRPDKEILPFLDAVEESGYPLARLVNEALKLYGEQVLKDKLGKLFLAAASLKDAPCGKHCTATDEGSFSEDESGVLENLKAEHIAAQSQPPKRGASKRTPKLQQSQTAPQ
jgi:hypothetical protein